MLVVREQKDAHQFRGKGTKQCASIFGPWNIYFSPRTCSPSTFANKCGVLSSGSSDLCTAMFLEMFLGIIHGEFVRTRPQTIDLVVSPSAMPSANQAVSQACRQTSNQPAISSPASQAADKPCNLSARLRQDSPVAGQLHCQPASQSDSQPKPSGQPASQPANEQASQSASQTVSQPRS